MGSPSDFFTHILPRLVLSMFEVYSWCGTNRKNLLLFNSYLPIHRQEEREKRINLFVLNLCGEFSQNNSGIFGLLEVSLNKDDHFSFFDQFFVVFGFLTAQTPLDEAVH